MRSKGHEHRQSYFDVKAEICLYGLRFHLRLLESGHREEVRLTCLVQLMILVQTGTRLVALMSQIYLQLCLLMEESRA